MNGGAGAGLDVDVVMVPRERYEPTGECLRHVLETVPEDVRIVVVRGGMPDRMVDAVKTRGAGRVTVVGPARHLAPNAARSIGLRHATARFVAFVDNDIEPAAGWLERLVDAATERDAWAVRPTVLQRARGEVAVHEAGGDCHLERRGSVTTLVETHRFFGQPLDVLESLGPEAVELFEFHTVLFDRQKLIDLGGPDETMLSQADHLDLALRVRSAGGSIWLEPAAEVTYTIPNRIRLRDLPFFLGRWSRTWNVASRDAFCAKHEVDDPGDPFQTWRYPELHRAYAWLPIGRITARLLRRSDSVEMARRFDRFVGRHLAEVALRSAPRWRGGGLEDER